MKIENFCSTEIANTDTFKIDGDQTNNIIENSY